jgi:hypothetical protein
MVRPPNPNQSHESFQYPPPGPSSVLEYQASGLPYVTQSTAPTAGTGSKVEFPFVTKFITVKNNGAGTLGVGFTENGVLGTNRFTLPPSGSWTGDIRVADIFFTTTAGSPPIYEVVAGLTQIPRRNWYILTGSLVAFSGTVAQQQAVGNRGFGYPGIG